MKAEHSLGEPTAGLHLRDADAEHRPSQRKTHLRRSEEYVCILTRREPPHFKVKIVFKRPMGHTYMTDMRYSCMLYIESTDMRVQ